RRGKSKPRWQATNQNQSLRQRSCRKTPKKAKLFYLRFESEKRFRAKRIKRKRKGIVLRQSIARITATSLLQKKPNFS
ncbi:hypothetical protein, partial [Flavobacterium sp.]|uniref:hypothetical protein n=1 Tax=Flavobacterium sp. TaxID=239 RepID=UPI0025BA3A77